MKKRKEYSTIVIVNKNNPDTKSYSIPSKHISRFKYYLSSVLLVIVALIAGLVFYINKHNENLAAKVELARFKKEIAGPLATDTNIANGYIEKIESKLVRLNKYLKQRGVKHPKVEVGGNETNSNISAINTYKYYNIYLASLLKNLKYMPLGYPHKNHNNSRFGYRSNPFHGGGSEFHSGIDIRGNIGDPIKSTAKGVVSFAGWSQGYGNCIRIKHDHGYETLYGHLSEIDVRKGQKVNAGRDIGKLGSTGRSTGPYLHYEVRYLDQPINPERFLDL